MRDSYTSRLSDDLSSSILNRKTSRIRKELREEPRLSFKRLSSLVEDYVNPVWKRVREKVEKRGKNVLKRFVQDPRDLLKDWEFRKRSQGEELVFQCFPGCNYCCERALKKFYKEDEQRLFDYLNNNFDAFAEYYKKASEEIEELARRFSRDAEPLSLELLLAYHDSRKANTEDTKGIMAMKMKNTLWGEVDFDFTIHNCLFFSESCAIHPSIIGRDIRPSCCDSVCIKGHRADNKERDLEIYLKKAKEELDF